MRSYSVHKRIVVITNLYPVKVSVMEYRSCVSATRVEVSGLFVRRWVHKALKGEFSDSNLNLVIDLILINSKKGIEPRDSFERL